MDVRVATASRPEQLFCSYARAAQTPAHACRENEAGTSSAAARQHSDWASGRSEPAMPQPLQLRAQVVRCGRRAIAPVARPSASWLLPAVRIASRELSQNFDAWRGRSLTNGACSVSGGFFFSCDCQQLKHVRSSSGTRRQSSPLTLLTRERPN